MLLLPFPLSALLLGEVLPMTRMVVVLPRAVIVMTPRRARTAIYNTFLLTRFTMLSNKLSAQLLETLVLSFVLL